MKLFKFTILSALCVFATAAFAQSSTSPLLQDVSKFRSDLRADLGTQISSHELSTLNVALLDIVISGHKPAQAAVDNLNAVLGAALADGVVSSAERTQILTAFDAAATSAGIAASDLQPVHTAFFDVLGSTRITSAQIQVLFNDFEAIFRDLPDQLP